MWSITYQDVEKAIKKEIATDLQSPLSSHQQRNRSGYSHQTDENVFQLNSMALLVLWLKNDEKERENALKVKQNTAAAALLKMVYDPSNADYIQVKQNLMAQWNSLPDWFSYDENSLPAISPGGIQPEVSYWWPQQFMSGDHDVDSSGMICLDDQQDPSEMHKNWRKWLWFYNHFQFLPGMLLTTKKGLQAHDYHVLQVVGTTSTAPAGWDLVLEDCFEEMRTGYQELASTGKPAPDEIGGEIADETGSVIAEVESLWNASRLALLRSDQEDYKEVLESLNWNVVMAEGNWQSEVNNFL